MFALLCESVECERMNSIACLFRGLLILLLDIVVVVVVEFRCFFFHILFRLLILHNLDYGLMPFSSHAQTARLFIGNFIYSICVLHLRNWYGIYGVVGVHFQCGQNVYLLCIHSCVCLVRVCALHMIRWLVVMLRSVEIHIVIEFYRFCYRDTVCLRLILHIFALFFAHWVLALNAIK